jgi:uncharacterized membrane protein YtjA (UPF0391 family)
MNKKALGGWLFWAVVFFIVAVIAGVLGFGGIAGFSTSVAIWLVIIFVVLFVISVIAHTIKRA